MTPAELDALVARARLTAGHDAAVLLMPHEALALVAEVERLREGEARRLQLLDDAGGLENERDALAREVAFLRACVPPTHPSHYGYEAWEERLRAEVERERAAVVAMLRAEASAVGASPDEKRVLHAVARCIKRGEHRREEKP